MAFEQSKILYERAQQSLAGGVSSHFRAGQQPHPLFFTHGSGSKLYDVDGREYIDYLLGQGPDLLGHAPPALVQAVSRALPRGQIFAGQTEGEVTVSETICRLVPCAELVRYSSSGSEVMQAALRLARAYTGRLKFIKFEGHYHGWFDNVAWSVHPPLEEAGPADAPRPVALSEGQCPTEAEYVLVLPWNDLEAVHRAVRQQGGEIAALVTEPIMCNTNCIRPEPGYLEGLRELCTQEGIVLIFDEVITGFRPCLGGAQEYLRVTPDLAIFGKALAGGFPQSVLAGKRELMCLLAEGRVVHAGTLNANLMCMAATEAMLNCLQAEGGAIYEHLFRLGQQLMEGLVERAHHYGHPALAQGLGPMFWFGFTEAGKITDYRSHLQLTDAGKYARFVRLMLEEGILLIGRGMWYVSAAHTEEDVECTLRAAEAALRKL